MIRRFVLLKRRHDISRPSFFAHWHEQHAPLVVKLRGLQRYVQHNLAPNDAGFDGVAELWFDSIGAQEEAYRSWEYQAILADEPTFLDINATTVYTVESTREVKLNS